MAPFHWGPRGDSVGSDPESARGRAKQSDTTIRLLLSAVDGGVRPGALTPGHF